MSAAADAPSKQNLHKNVLFILNTEVASMGLQRSKKNRMIAGVCGGIAKTLGWDPTLVRVTYVLASVLSAAFPGILVYIILWVLMPEENGETLGVNY
jgi:phage shock protein PspC (stress-responsive transcriptional regulator)